MGSGVYDGAIVIQAVQTSTQPLKNAEILVEVQKKYKKPIIGAFMGGVISEASIKYLEEHGVPNYNDVDRAARAMWALMEQGRYVRRRKL